MLAAEAGADYVMFGEPDAGGRRPAFDAVTERVAWWAELFEVPCVGFAAGLDEVEPLAAAGADFIAVGDCVFADRRGCAVAMADAARRLAELGGRAMSAVRHVQAGCSEVRWRFAWRHRSRRKRRPRSLRRHHRWRPRHFAQARFAQDRRSQATATQAVAQADRTGYPRRARQPRRRSQPRRDVDMAYGAFQRGFYMTAFAIATRRASENTDVKAMTLLGELYANGLGIGRDDNKAAEWYRLAADRGDREAMFALGLFHLTGRTGKVNREQGAKLFAAAAKLGHVAAVL